MSRRVHDAAFALTSEGTLLLNVSHFDGKFTPSQLLQWALGQPGKVFVGVQMSPAEVKKVLAWSRDVHDEAVAYVVGPRARRAGGARRAKLKGRY